MVDQIRLVELITTECKIGWDRSRAEFWTGLDWTGVDRSKARHGGRVEWAGLNDSCSKLTNPWTYLHRNELGRQAS